MISIRTSAVVPAPVDEVWSDLADIPAHAEWMRDAEEVRLHEGAIEADTRLGPLRITDRMEITVWEPEAAIEVRHVGPVTGTGRFALEAVDGEGTTLLPVGVGWPGGRADRCADPATAVCGEPRDARSTR